MKVDKLFADHWQGDQSDLSIAEYAIAFCTLAAECHWNQEALIAAFQNGLTDTNQGMSWLPGIQ